MITGNITFTAQYSVNKYTATFNSAGGTTYPTQSISYGSTVSNPGNPDRTGYTFTGWSPRLSTVMTDNRTFTAQWKVNTYTVSFNSNGGSAVGNQTIAYGSKAAVPSNPTRRNYVFNGWSPSISTTITGNRTFTAQWLYQDALYTYRAVTGGYEIAGFNTADFKNQPGGRQPIALTIPTNYRGSTIISIGPRAFQNKGITSVSMPNSIQ